MSATSKPEWPKVRITFRDRDRPAVVVTMAEARRDYGMRADTEEILREAGAYSVGPGLGVEFRVVENFTRYTADDAVRDAAPDLKAAVERLIAKRPHRLCMSRYRGAVRARAEAKMRREYAEAWLAVHAALAKAGGAA